jgi:hypothetical protein
MIFWLELSHYLRHDLESDAHLGLEGYVHKLTCQHWLLFRLFLLFVPLVEDLDVKWVHSRVSLLWSLDQSLGAVFKLALVDEHFHEVFVTRGFWFSAYVHKRVI